MKNPTLYIFAGNIDINAIQEQILLMHGPDEVVFAHINKDSSIDAQIRIAKSNLQDLSTASTHLDVTRTNVYVVANAFEQDMKMHVEMLSIRLRQLIAEDFSSFYITLVALLNEANNALDYDEINRNTYKFLLMLTGETGFDRVFLLSNRNQWGQVNEANQKNVHKTIASLPFLNTASSYFNSAVTAKESKVSRVLFASAGVGSVHSADNTDDAGDFLTNGEANQYWHKLAHILEDECKLHRNVVEGNYLRTDELVDVFNGILGYDCNTFFSTVVADITSVASKPIASHKLKGLTVLEAENAIFGENIKEFMTRNYSDLAFYCGKVSSDILDLAPDKLKQLRLLVEEQATLHDMVAALDLEILNLKQDIMHRAQETVKFFATMYSVKETIGKYYASKLKLEILQERRHLVSEYLAKVSQFLDHMRSVIHALTALKLPEKIEMIPETLLQEAMENAGLNISLLRDDGLVHETHVLGTSESPVVLKVIGGFSLEDMIRYNAMRQL